MATINLILQGKGGVGKSLIASLLAQYLIHEGCQVASFDTDPVNASFAAYKALKVHMVDIMDGDTINTRHFDGLMETLIGLPEDVHAVIDNGASTFLPLSAYMAENAIPEFLQDHGHDLRIHTVITGGQAEGDTFQGLSTLLKTFSSSVTVWINPFFGKTDFLESSLCQDNLERFEAALILPNRKKETFGADMEQMLSMKLTFAEVFEHPQFQMMAQQRLKMMQRAIFEMLKEADI